MQSAIQTMIDGIAHLRRAGQSLAAGNDDGHTPRSSVLTAAQEFWSAVFYSDAWPPELQQGRDALIERLLSGRVIQASIQAMDEAELRQTCQLIRDLVDRAEAECRSTTAASKNLA